MKGTTTFNEGYTAGFNDALEQAATLLLGQYVFNAYSCKVERRTARASLASLISLSIRQADEEES